ncbi:hypothetical protein ACSBR1_040287 [Camellia fascicularis]
MANKLADLQAVVNFMIQNNIMRSPFPLQDMPIPAAKKDAQKGGQNTVPAIPQHDKAKGHSHRPSREAGHGESKRARE